MSMIEGEIRVGPFGRGEPQHLYKAVFNSDIRNRHQREIELERRTEVAG